MIIAIIAIIATTKYFVIIMKKIALIVKTKKVAILAIIISNWKR
jgi:hypothetical protein